MRCLAAASRTISQPSPPHLALVPDVPPLKFRRQFQFELEGIQNGIIDYRKRVQDSHLAELPPGLAILQASLEPLTVAVEKFKAPARGAARMQEVRRFLNMVEVTSEELAYLTLRKALESLSAEITLQKAALSLVEMVMDQHEYSKFKAAHTGYLKKTEASLSLASQKHRRTVIMLKKRTLGIDDDVVERELQLRIGCKLLDLCVLSTGLIEKKEHDCRLYLRGTPKALEWIERVNERCELLTPHFLPMIVPPKKWSGIEGGGYLGNTVSLKTKLVKTRNRKALEDLSHQEMPKVYEALNAVQETPWRINRRVFEVMNTLWTEGSTLGGLPERDKEELPSRPWMSEEEFTRMKEEDPERVKAWKRQTRETYERFIKNRGKRTAVSLKLRTAAKFLEEEEIYFPHVLDWRGRVYPVTGFINPQADDIGKGLLQFAKGKPLGKDGLRWLKIHLANTYGYDKASFDDRCRWVAEHLQEILDSAENPLDGLRFWTNAASPYCFLAACFEIAGAVAEGEAFVSHLPIALDGTCSGLQHFSAMLKDSSGGAAVNLLPADRPQDIYARVAAKVSEMVEADAQAGVEEAALWRGKVDRGITKRAVMTSPYGARKYGFKYQLLAELQKRGADYLGTSDPFKACTYLAGKMWEAIGFVVVAARDAMEWLQEVSKVCSEAQVPVWWTTPVGFRAHQEYFKTYLKRVDTFWGGVKVRLALAHDTSKLDTRKQGNGIAPNVVHSLDASHLMLTVLRCKERGLTDFAMIHDSFGVHACDTSTLAATLRETFVDQYTGNVLEAFRQEILRQLPEALHKKVPPVPPMGDLDIEAVKLSEYFFA